MEMVLHQFTPKLTTREQEILRYVAEGFSTKDIARILSISAHTVANHRRNILRKKGVKSSVQLFNG
jgi:DNA-binding CsgD family transcriptional regulator